MDKIGVFLKLDQDLVAGYKALAEATPGGKYQAIMHEALRLYLGKEAKDGFESRLARIEKLLLKKT